MLTFLYQFLLRINKYVKYVILKFVLFRVTQQSWPDQSFYWFDKKQGLTSLGKYSFQIGGSSLCLFTIDLMQW